MIEGGKISRRKGKQDMQLADRVGEYRKKGNNKAIDDYRVNPIGQRNHPRITVTTDSSDRFYRGNYAEGRQRYFRNTLRDPCGRDCVLTSTSTLIRNFTHHLFFIVTQRHVLPASTPHFIRPPVSYQFTHEFSVDERCKR